MTMTSTHSERSFDVRPTPSKLFSIVHSFSSARTSRRSCRLGAKDHMSHSYGGPQGTSRYVVVAAGSKFMRPRRESVPLVGTLRAAP